MTAVWLDCPYLSLKSLIMCSSNPQGHRLLLHEWLSLWFWSFLKKISRMIGIERWNWSLPWRYSFLLFQLVFQHFAKLLFFFWNLFWHSPSMVLLDPRFPAFIKAPQNHIIHQILLSLLLPEEEQGCLNTYLLSKSLIFFALFVNINLLGLAIGEGQWQIDFKQAGLTGKINCYQRLLKLKSPTIKVRWREQS